MSIASAPALATGPSLAAVEQAALQRQPQIDAIDARVRAAQSRAISAAQLPDPMLSGGITNLPLSGTERYSLRRDDMTMTSVGIAQEFPRAEKRSLRGSAENLAAAELQQQRAVLQRAIRRDSALAWLNLWSAERALRLLDAQLAEAGREREAALIALRSGSSGQADVLAVGLAVELLEDRRARTGQDVEVAREQLARWTGEVPDGPVPDVLPDLPAPSGLPVLVAALAEHPELRAARGDIAMRENAVAQARADFSPDWRAELMYGYRPDYADMATLQVSIDLPLFTARRQSPELAAASAELDAVEAMHADHHRMLAAEAAASWRAWSQSAARLQRYDDTILPTARARGNASLAAYRAGRATLASVLDARRGVLDIELMRLELQTEVLRQLLALRYFADSGDQR